jgi:hypothetical protein
MPGLTALVILLLASFVIVIIVIMLELLSAIPVRIAKGIPEMGMPLAVDNVSAKENPMAAVVAERAMPGRSNGVAVQDEDCCDGFSFVFFVVMFTLLLLLLL